MKIIIIVYLYLYMKINSVKTEDKLNMFCYPLISTLLYILQKVHVSVSPEFRSVTPVSGTFGRIRCYI